MNCPYCDASIPSVAIQSESASLYACQGCLNPVVIEWVDNNSVTRPIPHTKDIRHVASEGSVAAEIFSLLPKAIENLAVLPEISQRILAMTGDQDISMSDLAAVVSEDQATTIGVLKLANSAAHRGFNEVKDLDSACTRLGMKRISNTVQAIANGNLYETKDARLQELMQKLWQHAIATAHFAGGLATMLVEPNGQMLFVAGLIHDIGKVVLLDIIATGKSSALKELRKSEEIFDEIMRNFHPLVGLHVVQAWGLPPEFRISTYCHFDPALTPGIETLRMVHITAMANAIAKASGFEGTEEEEPFLSSHPSARQLNLNDIKLASLRVDLAEQLEALIETVSIKSSASA
jgi:HD-like signal output (HDOD) protein